MKAEGFQDGVNTSEVRTQFIWLLQFPLFLFSRIDHLCLRSSHRRVCSLAGQFSYVNCEGVTCDFSFITHWIWKRACLLFCLLKIPSPGLGDIWSPQCFFQLLPASLAVKFCRYVKSKASPRLSKSKQPSKQPFSSLNCSNRAETQQVGVFKVTLQVNPTSPWTNTLLGAEVPNSAEQHLEYFLSLKIPKIACPLWTL